MSKSRQLLVYVLLALIPVGLYGQTITFEFLDFDDAQYITMNGNIRAGLTWENLLWSFRSLYASNWHPLTWLSHMVDIQLFGFRPAGHHLTNLVFHTANTLILFALLRRMTGALWQSLAVAVLFAAHPLHVESVAYLAERKDLLSTFFWFLTMAAYAGYAARGGAARYLVVVTLFALGLMAKPMLVTLPVVLLLMDYWPLNRLRRSGEGREGRVPGYSPLSPARLVMEKLPLFLLSAAAAVITLVAQKSGGSVRVFTAQALMENGANALLSYVRYLLKTVWPVRLAAYYPYDPHLPGWQVTGAFLLLVTLTLLAVRMRRRHPYLVVGWLWYLVTLLPVIGIVQVGLQSMADRYTYIPLIGIFIAVAWGVAEVAAPWRRRRAILTVSAILVMATLLPVAWVQIGHWRNGVTLFAQTVAVTENNWLAHHNLGVALLKRGSYDEALRHLEASREINPGFMKTYYNLGDIYFAVGNPELAIASYRRALDIDPDYYAARLKLAASYQRWGYLELAAQERDTLSRMTPPAGAQ